ncbi:MAG: glycoside hydrolase family 16 protein [Flavobacteriales bacterium]
MPRLLLLAFLMLDLSTCRAQAPSQWWWFMKDTLERYAYAGGDEFEGRTLDRAFWMTSGEGRRNHHGTHMQEYNTDGGNAVLDDGTLRMQLRKEQVTARGVEYEPDTAKLGDGGPNLRTWNYTSTLLVSHGIYQFGLFEARIKLSTGQGAWPSFWLFGGQPNEEIDILEGKGERPDQFHVDVHCPGHACDDYRNPLGAFGRWLGVNWQSFGTWKRADAELTGDFNDYLGEWTPDALRFYLNGSQCAEWKGTLHVPERVILQNALANTCKGCPFGPGPEVADPMFTDMVVDHVRIWRPLLSDDPLVRSGIAVEPLLGINLTEVDVADTAANVRYEVPMRNAEPRGGKRGKVKKGFRVKTFTEPASRTVRIDVQGDVPKTAFVLVQLSGGRLFTPRIPLREGSFTFSLAGAAPASYDVVVVSDGRIAGERLRVD